MTAKPTLQNLKTKCKKLHIEFDSRIGDYATYAPKGYRFSASNSHVLTATHRGVKQWKQEAIQDLLHDISYGLHKCPKNCECKE